MSQDRTGYLYKIDGRIDAELYYQILKGKAQTSLEWWKKGPVDIIIIIEYGNNPKHTSKLTKLQFRGHRIQITE